MDIHTARKLKGKEITLYTQEGEVVSGEVGEEFHDFGRGNGEMKIGDQWWPTAFLVQRRPFKRLNKFES